MDVKNALKALGTAIKKHSPEILTGIGIAGFITTTVLAVKATPAAVEAIKKDSRANHDGDPYAYTQLEAVKSGWKYYIPSMVSGTISATCIVCGCNENLRRNAALATAYTLSENALREYQDKVVSVVGKEKEKEIRDEIAKDKIAQNPVSTKEVYLVGGKDTLFYESISGRYFTNDIEGIRSIVNNLNKRMLTESYISLNDLFYELGLSEHHQWDDLGWNIDGGFIELEWSAQISDDGRPCLVIEYRTPPTYRYDYFS